MNSFLIQHKKNLLIAALLVLLTLFAMWIYKNITWEEVEIDRGYSKEALKNDFLAAELFLKKQGVAVTHAKNFILLDKFSWRNTPLGDKDTIILINGHKTLSQTRYDNLMKWVENGGTLIASTQNPFIGDHTDAQDLLLENFGIEITPEVEDTDNRSAMDKLTDELKKISKGDQHNEDETDKEAEPENETLNDDVRADKKNDPAEKNEAKESSAKTKKPTSDKHYRCHHQEPVTNIAFYGEDKPLAFDFSQASAFTYYENNEDASDGELMHLVYFDHGEGSITITSDNSIWENRRIDCHDHAYGLWRLINPEGRVWILMNQDAPSLWIIVWRNAAYGAIAALIGLFLWLWAKSQRFGPILVNEQLARRSLAEHIYASAMLLWRKQQHPQLIKLLRNDISERINQYHPHIAHASQHEQLVYLQQLTHISTRDIQHALFAEDLRHPQLFTTAVAALQTIRKAL